MRGGFADKAATRHDAVRESKNSLTPPDDNTVYILNENDGTIYELFLGAGAPAYGNRWTCELRVTEGNMPAESAAGDGVEGLAFVPDSFLASSGFVDGNGNPYTASAGGFGGVFMIGHQIGGFVYVFDLTKGVDDQIAFVGKYQTGYSEIAGLEFDRACPVRRRCHAPPGRPVFRTRAHA